MHIFQPEDYIGEFNLNALERRIIVRELTKTQMLTKASVLLKFSERTIDNKIKAHRIEKSEWKTERHGKRRIRKDI